MDEEKAFYKSSLDSTSFWGKIKGQKSEKNAVTEINNLFSETPIMDVSAQDIQAILDKYELNLYTDFSNGSLRELYKTYLRFCFDDNHLDEEEITRLKQLKKLLGLTDKAVEIANHQVCQEVYERELDAALEDHRLDEKELEFLRQLQNRLQLPQSWADSLYQHKAQSIIIQFVKGAIADERLSPDEEEEMKALADNLGVAPDLDAATQAELAKYRLFWQIENGELPAIYVPIKLKSNEQCYFLADAYAYEEKKNLKANEDLPLETLRVRLGQGNYWHSDQPLPFVSGDGDWKTLAHGKAYLTNQKLILRQDKTEKNIKLGAITNFRVYPNGIMLYRDKSKRLFLQTNENTDVFAMILGRVLRAY